MLSNSDLLQLIADPIVQTGSLAVIGVLVTRFALRNHPTRRLIGQVIFFAALTLLLLYHGIVPYETVPRDASTVQRVFIGLAKVIWWTNAAWALAAFVRVFLIFERQPREVRLLQDLVVGTIYLGAAFSVIANVFSVPLGTLIATSGILAIILGLAMQSTLNDVFSGIALNLGRPYAIGDWIVLSDGIEGRVVETNWRATHLIDGGNDLVILPNSGLAKSRLTNMSSPDRSHGVTLTVRFAPTMRPAAISDVMRTVLLSCRSILRYPEPNVQVKALDAHAVAIEISFRTPDLASVGRARSEVFDLIYRHAKAAGLRLSPPLEAAGMPAQSPADAPPVEHRPTPLRLLDAIPLFAALTEDEKETLAATMSRRTYRQNEVVVDQGATLRSLMVVRSGALIVTRREQERDLELNRLAPGDWFGAGGLLTGTPEPCTIRAATFVVVYEIAQAGLAPLMRDRPVIAEELGLSLSRGAETERHLFGEGQQAVAAAQPPLIARIRQLFEI